jgi:transposase InsO family protein
LKAQDVTDTLDLALVALGCDQARIVHKPRLVSDNGSSYVSAELADWLIQAARTWGRSVTDSKIPLWFQEQIKMD